MKTILKKPTTLQMSIGLMVSIAQAIFTKSNHVVPQRIGKYTLLTKITKENHFNDYSVGIYKYKKEKVFIKTWSSRIKNFAYYELINEYLINKLLYEKLKFEKISIPKVIGNIKSKHTLSLIFEYIDGKKLSSFPLNKQVQAVSDVIDILLNLSESLSEEEKENLPKRTVGFYMFSLPFLVCLTILSNIKNFRVILKAYIEFIYSFRTLSQIDNLYLAHRDLNLHNMILRKSRIFLLDCGRIALTIRNYDIAQISINPKRRETYKVIARRFNYKENKFITNYILINQARAFGDPNGVKNIFMEELYKRYEYTTN